MKNLEFVNCARHSENTVRRSTMVVNEFCGCAVSGADPGFPVQRFRWGHRPLISRKKPEIKESLAHKRPCVEIILCRFSKGQDVTVSSRQ